MIALEVSRNGNKLCLAGADDLGVLLAIVEAIGSLGPKTKHHRTGWDLGLRMGGLTSRGEGETDEFLRWVGDQGLEIGDEIAIRVLNVDQADEPAVREVSNNNPPKDQ